MINKARDTLLKLRFWILGIVISLVIGWFLLSHTRLHLCLTPSLEGIRALLFFKTNNFSQNDIVFIQGHVYKHLDVPLENQIFAKRIVGLPGDILIRDIDTIKIIKALPLVQKTKEGHSLTPTQTQVVPEGHVFVAGDHPRSIDSRYEEFGLVPVEKIWGKAVFTW